MANEGAAGEQDAAPSLRLVLMGTAEFAVPSLLALTRGPDQVVGVFTPPDRPAGRGRHLRPSAVKVAALELGIPVLQPERVSRGEGLEQLRCLQPDLVVVAAFGEILTEEALAVPRLGAINLHASLLPRYRGAAPIQRAIMAGERVTGVSVQWMTRQLDAGDLILQRQVEIGEEEDFGSLHGRLTAVAAGAAVEALALIRRGEAPRIAQDHSQATLAPPITAQDLAIVWARTAGELARQVRALSPHPGARTVRGQDLLKVLAAQVEGAARQACAAPGKTGSCEGGIPGQVMEVSSDGLLVMAGDGCLCVSRVQPAGRKAMSAADYVKGYRLQTGDRLGD